MLVDGREMSLRESGLSHPSVVSAGNGAGDATRLFFLLVLVMAGGESASLNAKDCLASRSLQAWRRASASSSSLARREVAGVEGGGVGVVSISANSAELDFASTISAEFRAGAGAGSTTRVSSASWR